MACRGDKEGGESGEMVQTSLETDSLSSSFYTVMKSTVGKEGQPLIIVRDEPAPGRKAKRRRTSPQDHAILEAAYLANSKPDKADRAQLVSKVDMGEKEVQIWFQNRRQNDRRRSKPLDPLELMAHIRKPQTPPATALSDSSSESEPSHIASHQISSCHHAHPTSTSTPVLGAAPSPATSIASEPGLLSFSTDVATSSAAPLASPRIKADQTPPSTADSNVEKGKKDHPTTTGQDVSERNSPGGSARKRNHAEMSRDAQQAPPSKPKEPLKRSSSVRLSMTADGAVKVRTSDSLSPSPRKERPSPAISAHPRPIRRSLSLFEDGNVSQGTLSAKARVHTAGFGRSRDARTWEFYCDNSSKDALLTQIEAERSGSAVGEINLIRSNKTRPRGYQMSAAASRIQNMGSQSQAEFGKPKMMRAQSSLARLQSSENGKPCVEQVGAKASRHVRSGSGDSDKENWAPGTRMSDNPLRRTQPSNNRRPVLQSNEGVLYRDVKPTGKTAGKPLPAKGATRGDDLECIQGLLSLSQGAWR